MADIAISSKKRNPGHRFTTSKKHSTRVDLTPMVDLGFLLITFFIYTTSLTDVKSLPMMLPDDTGKPQPVKESATLTLLLAADHQVFYFKGKGMDKMPLPVSSLRNIRDVIEAARSSADQRFFSVIIKPSDHCVLQDVVDIMDEMAITGVTRHAITDISSEENRLITQ